jgi:hypothetical protein
MMRANFTAESADLSEIETGHIKAGKEYEYLWFDFGANRFTLYLDPKDLPRVASMFRHAAESIEAIIAQNGANHAPEAIRDLPAPSLASAA